MSAERPTQSHAVVERPTKPRAIAEREGVYRFPTRLEASPRELVWDDLVACAKRAGAEHFALTPPEPLEEGNAALKRWLGAGFHGEMRFLERPERGDPRALLPEAQSVVVVAIPHSRQGSDDDRVARYALGRDYHHVVRTVLLDLGEQLAIALGRPLTGRICVDSAPLLEREVARRAGLGFIGKSTLSIVPGLGSYFMLGELLLDTPLPASPPRRRDAGCGQCTRCLDACPTGAFVEPFVLDARRCISYLTIELQGAIPRDLRDRMGTRVFGCDECQAVCPFNSTKKAPPGHTELAPHARLLHLDLLGLVQLSSTGYRRLAKRTALRRTTREQLRRNAAIALGNASYPDVESREAAVAALAQTLRDATPLVRAHAAWALGRLRTESARRALAECAEVEVDSVVQEELALALGRPREIAAAPHGTPES